MYKIVLAFLFFKSYNSFKYKNEIRCFEGITKEQNLSKYDQPFLVNGIYLTCMNRHRHNVCFTPGCAYKTILISPKEKIIFSFHGQNSYYSEEYRLD